MLTYGKIMNFLTTTQTKKHLTTVCASEKSLKNFLSVAENFLEKLLSQKLTKQIGHEIIWSIYRLESLYTFAVQSHDFLASTLDYTTIPDLFKIDINLNSNFKFDKYEVEKGNKKSVSKTYDSAKNIHTALFFIVFCKSTAAKLLMTVLFNFEWVIYRKLWRHLHRDI